MGYFSSGSEGMDYEEHWCRRCLNGDGEGAGRCVVWMLHELKNYDECNKPDSILHYLIPRTKDGLGNGKCEMFKQRAPSKPKRKLAERQLLVLDKPVR